MKKKIVSLIPTGKPHEYTEISVAYGDGSFWAVIATFTNGKHCISREYGPCKRIMTAEYTEIGLDKAVALVKSVYGI